jgi:hypothetical protein
LPEVSATCRKFQQPEQFAQRALHKKHNFGKLRRFNELPLIEMKFSDTRVAPAQVMQSKPAIHFGE